MPDELYKYLKELNSFKLEFMDTNDNYHRIDSYIKVIQEDYVLIAPPAKQGNIIDIADNAEVNLVFSKDNGVLIAQCSVLGKELGIQSGIKVSFPYKTKVLERREYVRVPLKLRAEVIYYLDREYTQRKSFSVTTKNLSGNGFSFYHKEPLTNYYDIQAKIFLNDENPKSVEIPRCDQVYSKKVKTKDGTILYFTALTFVSISDEDSSRIIKQCFKYQIKQKHLKD